MKKPASHIEWNETLNAWALRRHEDVTAVLLDPRFSAASANGANDSDFVPDTKDPVMDRQHLSKGIQQQLRWACQQMETTARSFCEKMANQRKFDLQQELVFPCCQQIALTLCGVDAAKEEASLLTKHAWEVFSLTEDGDRQEGEKAMAALSAIFLELIEQRKKSPGDDLVSAFAKGEDTPSILLSPSIQLFIGLATSMPLLLGNILLALLTEPIQAQIYLSQPVASVNELMRFAGPAHIVYRLATTDINVGGHLFKRGERLALLLAEANRDPAVFEAAESLSLSRQAIPHLSFGKGAHSCLGASLIREAVAVIPFTILHLFPMIQADLASVQWGGSRAIRGITKMQVFNKKFEIPPAAPSLGG